MSDDSYDAIDRLIDTDPIELGRACRMLGQALGSVLVKLGILNDQPLTGPELVAAADAFCADPNHLDHFVTFTEDRWFIEHSLPCRIAGNMGTCAYHAAIVEVSDDDTDPDLGRWRITEIDTEGLPALERADV